MVGVGVHTGAHGTLFSFPRGIWKKLEDCLPPLLSRLSFPPPLPARGPACYHGAVLLEPPGGVSLPHPLPHHDEG